MVEISLEDFHGPVGDGRRHLCIDPDDCTTPSHSKGKNGFGFQAGHYIQVKKGVVLAKPFLPKRAGLIYNELIKRAFANGAPKTVLAGFIFTITELEKTGMSSEDKLRDAEAFVDSMLNQGGATFDDKSYDLAKATLTPQKLPKAESVIKPGAISFPTEDERVDLDLDLDSIEEELKEDARQSSHYTMKMLRDLTAQNRVTGAQIGAISTMETTVIDMIRDLQDDMQDVLGQVEEMHADAAKANDTISSQAKTIGSLQQQIDDLKTLTQGHSVDIQSLLANVNQFVDIVEEINRSASNCMVTSPDTSALEKKFDALKAKVEGSGQVEMGERLTSLEEEFASSNNKLIELGGGSITFQNETKLSEFCDKYPEDSAELLSADMLFMMGLLGRGTVDVEEMQQSELHAAKVQRSQTQTIHAAAYSSNYPPLLVGRKQTDLPTGRVLFSAIRTYSLFNKNNGREGIANVIRKNLPTARRKLELEIEQKLQGPQLMEQRMLAKYLVSKSCDFIYSLIQFMERMRLELLTHGHGDGPYSAAAEAQVWELVLLMLMACLDCLNEHRCEASQGYLDPKTANFVYLKAALRTHMEMERFVATNFSEHPSIAPKLQRYIFETFVSKTDFEELKGTVKTLKRSFDSFVSQSGGGGGGGGGGDDLSPAQKRKQKKAAAKAKEEAEE